MKLIKFFTHKICISITTQFSVEVIRQLLEKVDIKTLLIMSDFFTMDRDRKM